MTCSRHGGSDAGNIICRECDLEIIEEREKMNKQTKSADKHRTADGIGTEICRLEYEKWVTEQANDPTGRPEACDQMTWDRAWQVAISICESVESNALTKYHNDLQANKPFWNGVAAGAWQCADVLKGEYDHEQNKS